MRADVKDAISSLIIALQGHRVAKRLRSKDTGGAVDRELASIYVRIGVENFEPAPFLPLIHTVVKKASDIEIWKSILQLVVSTSRITPPPSKPSYGGTPIKYGSASHQGSEQTKMLLEQALRDELWDCSYINVPGFFEKYFGGKSWTQQSKDMFDKIKQEHADGRWTTFPNPPAQDAVWQWLSDFQDRHFTNLPGLYYTTKSKSEMAGVDAEGQLDFFVKNHNKPSSDAYDWADVRVVGEHTVSVKESKFQQLSRYAHHIFTAQPRRRFLHGFTLCHDIMELYIFDRSGSYSAEPFDIQAEPERFIRALSGYCMMSDEEIGLDTFIEREGTKEFVTVVEEKTEKQIRLQMENNPIARQAAIVGRGTSCYRTFDQESVIKFAWPDASRWLTEPQLLRAAQEKKVKGVARLGGYKRITSVSEHRACLKFKQKRQMQSRQRKSGASVPGSQSATMPLSDEPRVLGGKRESTDSEDASCVKKSRSNSQTSRLSQVHGAKGSVNNPRASKTTESTSEPFIDRVLICQLLTPAGRPLDSFASVTELLRVLRDAIKGHYSLFFDGKILHRDISPNNIIITDPDKADGFSGMLIDTDLSTTVDIGGKNQRSGAQRMTGTLKYMAIEVVQLAIRDARHDLEHTYRHDLESFFYVFLSTCVSYGQRKKKTAADPFRSWYVGSHEDILANKAGCMERGRFDTLVLTKFTPECECVKDLAWILRDALFLRGELRTGTPQEDPSILYDQMINAFDGAIKNR